MPGSYARKDTEMVKHSDAALALLRANLGFYGSSVPEELAAYLEQLLDYSYDEFGAMEIVLFPGELQDDMDQMTYAAWLYRNGTTGAGKTQQLRDIIRNRQVRQALEEGST